MNHTKPGIKEGWKRVALFIITYIICSLVASILLSTLNLLSPMGFTYILIFLTGMISIILVEVFGYRFRKKTSNKDPGNTTTGPENSNRQRIKDSVSGILLSTGLIGAGSFILYLIGVLQWSVNNIQLTELVLPLALMIWIAFYEELVFRGFILDNLLCSFKKPVALLLSAFIFALFHAFNPATSILALVNIFTGGILIGLTYMHNRNLWFPVFFHLGWNFIQGPVLGFPVSGIPLPSLLQADLTGSKWLHGGTFGFEGSVIQLVVVLIGIIILLSSRKQN